MRKRFFLGLGFLLVTLTTLTFLTNRRHAPNDTAAENTRPADSAQVNHTAALAGENDSTAKANDTLTDIANFIAGINRFSTTYLSKLVKDTSWHTYASKIDRTWQKLDTIRYRQMDNWVENQISTVTGQDYNLLYPFSGPDFLNADIFFPEADTLTMFGLEPVGSLPAVQKEWFRDSLDQYVQSLKKSLHTILNLSFFKTKDMFSDLRAHELNGATHLILWFAARRGYSINEVHPIALDYTGAVIEKNGADTAYQHSAIRGIEIACVKNNRTKLIRYFSADISNHGFKKNARLGLFLNAAHFSNTLVKSASYLMHAGNFTTIRNIILNKTTNLLQDDTGIPYRNLSSNTWDITLFGTYEKPINLFVKNYQDDLRKAYDSLETKTLPFGIGYKYRKNESTWMLIRRQHPQAKLTAKR